MVFANKLVCMPFVYSNRATFVLLLALAANAAHGETGDKLPTLSLSRFVEHETQHVNVGGRPIIGVTSIDESESGSLAPAIRIPSTVAASSPSLCIETSSIDGSYSSSGQIDGPEIMASHGQFRFRYQDKNGTAGKNQFDVALRKFRPPGMATLAEFGSCDQQGIRNRFVVVDRSLSSASDGGIKLYVNTTQYDIEVRYATRGGVEQSVQCQDMEGEAQRVAFSATCTLPGPFSPTTNVILTRSRYGRLLPPLMFELVFASPALEAAQH